MKVTKKDIFVLSLLLKKLKEDMKNEKTRIKQRRKAQIRGKTINKIIQKRKKYTVRRRPAKRRTSIR